MTMNPEFFSRLGRSLQRLRSRVLGQSKTAGDGQGIPEQAAGRSATGFEVFLTPDALAINRARLAHLDSLGLDLSNKRVLEVGAGIGLHTKFFLDRGCKVLCTDANPENVAEVGRRYPGLRVEVLDLDHTADISHLGKFDIVYCYGTLYHLSKPEQALRALAEVCERTILLETCVSLGNYSEACLVREPKANNMAFSSIGCRPTRLWVMEMLRRYFGYSYVTKTQPRHPDFELNWHTPAFQLLHRAVFVGSKIPVESPHLLDSLPNAQACLEDTKPEYALGERMKGATTEHARQVWLDVGAHLGETTFEAAKANPNLVVYAFEPNLRLAAERFGVLENYVVIPMAVAECDGFSSFYVNCHDAASSLLAFNQEGLKSWIGGEVLEIEREVPVPTIRLDTFLMRIGCAKIDLLKIDAQGADFEVLMSAGDRLKDIRKIILEIAVTPVQLYEGAKEKSVVIDFLERQGFVLFEAQKQTHGQEENLTFMRSRR